MVKIWLCRDGSTPTSGSPLGELPLAWFQTKLSVAASDYLSDLATLPRFGQPDDPMANLRGYQHVVVEVAEEEAKAHGWKPGFYRSLLTPQQAVEAYNETQKSC